MVSSFIIHTVILLNGKPLVYLEDESDKFIDNENITVMNAELTNIDVGIELWQSDNCLISNNNISSNDEGIYFGGRFKQ